MKKVRFAPSPTGYLHIGGARTALFNWLFAKAEKASFTLRIEDTDAKRSKKEYLDEILFSMRWLGMEWDELYYQSERFKIYADYAGKLLSSGLAYEAEPLSVEGGEALPGGKAIILKVSGQKVVMRDLIRGEIEFDTSVIKDQVLIKSDGTPTYNFACVVDDALMEITHVIRGDDHISNTPKQLLLYQSLGFPVPAFAHLPLILAKEGGRLSKRKGATAISEYRDAGFLPEALVNFLLLLGWSPGENREIISVDEAVKLFNIKDINKTAAILDMDKLNWINNQYLKNKDPAVLAEQLVPLLAEKGFINKDNFDRKYLVSLVQLFQSRLTVLQDFVERADFFFTEDVAMDEAAREKYLSADRSREFRLFAERLKVLEPFTVEAIENSFRQLVEELAVQARELVHPVRVALTGKTVGPGLFEVIYHLGRDRSVSRLSRWITKESK